MRAVQNYEYAIVQLEATVSWLLDQYYVFVRTAEWYTAWYYVTLSPIICEISE